MRERATIDELRALLAVCAASDLPPLLRELDFDPRAGVRELARVARGRLDRARAEQLRLEGLMAMQKELHRRGLRIVAGVDEVGRGALAGPVTTCAVVLHPDTLIAGLDDSKRVPRDRRPALAAVIRVEALAVCVAHATPREIDSLGIGGATRLAWRRAIEGLGGAVDHVLVDGNDAAVDFPATAVIGGDSRCACIAAASVVAKVERDRLMEEDLAPLHPVYGFELNRGYGTPEHLAAIALHGPSPVHRRSFAPCSEQGSLF
jgi:ribonuclease HII